MGDHRRDLSSSVVPSEFLVAKRWDICRDAVLKSTGYGALYGSLSIFLFGMISMYRLQFFIFLILILYKQENNNNYVHFGGTRVVYIIIF